MSKKLIIFAIVVIIGMGGFVNAEEGIDIKIDNGTLTIEGYSKNADFGKFPAGFIDKINDSLSSSLSCDSLSLTVVNETNSSHTYPLDLETNCHPVLNYAREIKFDFNNSGEASNYCLSDSELIKDYIVCEKEKVTFEVGYNKCTSDNFDKVGLESNLTTCNTELSVCRSERTNAQNEKTRIENETEDTKNQKWTFGIGGLIVGVVGTLWYTGRIGGPKTKDPKESHNVMQAG